MIKVYFPPGCYGTYVSQCIYSYTNLRTGPFVNYIDAIGSSHRFRSKVYELAEIIRYGHIDNPFMIKESKQVVVVFPDRDHLLDYYNNQFYKQSKKQLINFILEQTTKEEILYKLKTYWGYVGDLDENVPRWILREWWSFCIDDILNANWEATIHYNKLNAKVNITTQDIFKNWIETLTHIVSTLDLNFIVDINIIKKQHETFLELQKLHNSQLRCYQYVKDLINGADGEITLHTIFDEAYMQQLLRRCNIAIQCDGLNKFPSTIQQLRYITYEASDHTNT